MSHVRDLNAGPFAAFVDNILAGHDADVPCNECNACCRSSYFIQIRGFEADSLAQIPQTLRFQAPGAAEGDQVMGFDEQGACPMLSDGLCSIYAGRPQTCRQYDCRIFAACGIAAGGEEKAAVNTQVQRWQFDLSSERDQQTFCAVQDAVAFLQTQIDKFPKGFVPDNPTGFALLALHSHKWFLPAHAELSTEARIQNIVAGT